jgi:hypothetical protein
MELLDFLKNKRELLKALKGDPSGHKKGEIDYFKDIIDYHRGPEDSFIADFRDTISRLLEINEDSDKNEANDLWERFLKQKESFYELVLNNSFDKVMTSDKQNEDCDDTNDSEPILDKDDIELEEYILDSLKNGLKLEQIIENLIPDLKRLPDQLMDDASEDGEGEKENEEEMEDETEDNLKKLRGICENTLMAIIKDGLKSKNINDDAVPYFEEMWKFLKKIPKGETQRHIMEFDRSLEGVLLYRKIGFGWGWIKNIIDKINRKKHKEYSTDDDTASEVEKNKLENQISKAFEKGEKQDDHLTNSLALAYNDIIFFVMPKHHCQQFEPWLLRLASSILVKKTLLSGFEKKLILACLTHDQKWQEGQKPNLLVTERILTEVKEWQKGLKPNLYIEKDILTKMEKYLIGQRRQKFKLFKQILYCNSEILQWKGGTNFNNQAKRADMNIGKLNIIIKEYLSKIAPNTYLPIYDFLQRRNFLNSKKNKNISLEEDFKEYIENPSASFLLRLILNKAEQYELETFVDEHISQAEMISDYFHQDSARIKNLRLKYKDQKCQIYGDIQDIPGLKKEVIGTFGRNGGEK